MRAQKQTPTPTASAPRLLTAPATVRCYGLGPPLLRRLRRASEIASVKAGHRSILYDRASIEAWIERNRTPAIGDQT